MCQLDLRRPIPGTAAILGLHLTAPLSLEREFNVPESLIHFERRMREDKEAPILERRRLQLQQM